MSKKITIHSIALDEGTTQSGNSFKLQSDMSKKCWCAIAQGGTIGDNNAPCISKN